MEEEARERTSCTSFVRCNDMWLAKDNRFLNPMSTYERNLMAPTCLIINNYYGATDILFQTLLTLQPGPYFLSLFIFWLLVFSSSICSLFPLFLESQKGSGNRCYRSRILWIYNYNVNSFRWYLQKWETMLKEKRQSARSKQPWDWEMKREDSCI